MAETNANPFAMYDIATRIKGCILPYLEGTSKGLPDRTCVAAGLIAWDNCECGQLVVSMQRKNEVNAPNLPRSAAVNPGRRECGPPLMQADFLVSMLRCAPSGGGVDGNGNVMPPTCEELDAAARVSSEDAWAVMAGVTCCLAEAIKTRQEDGTKLYVDFTIGQQTFVGPDGMCMGSELPVSVVIDNGCYPCGIS